MNLNDRQLLKNQLEQQAKLFVEEQDNTKLTASVLAACTALLRAAEKNMPREFSQQEFDNVFAGYLGIVSRVNKFYENNMGFFNETESDKLKQILTFLDEIEKKKKNLDDKIANCQKSRNDAEAEVKRLEAEAAELESSLAEEEKKIHENKEKRSELERELEDIKEERSKLEHELEDIKSKTDNLEPSIETLIDNVKTARDTYEEMLAYYPELQRIKAGIGEEGFVDVESFSKRLQEMNNSGKKIMDEYDSILKALTGDIEDLLAKIEKRRKAGAVG